MKKRNLAMVTLATTMALFAVPMTANAMPGDLKEAYNNAYYEAYYQNYGAYPNEYYTDEYYSYVDYAGGENFQAIDELYVAVNDANVYDYPNGNVIGSVKADDAYYVEGVCTDCHWYKIKGFDQDAYIYADNMVSSTSYQEESGSNSEDGYDFQPIDLKMLATVDVNMREVPGGNIVGVLKEGEEIHVTGNVNNRSWYRCEYKGETVYVSDDYLTPELPQTMVCTADYVNIRESADVNSKVIGVLRKGDKVKVSQVENDFYKFTYDKMDVPGYAFDEYLAAL